MVGPRATKHTRTNRRPSLGRARRGLSPGPLVLYSSLSLGGGGAELNDRSGLPVGGGGAVCPCPAHASTDPVPPKTRGNRTCHATWSPAQSPTESPARALDEEFSRWADGTRRAGFRSVQGGLTAVVHIRLAAARTRPQPGARRVFGARHRGARSGDCERAAEARRRRRGTAPPVRTPTSPASVAGLRVRHLPAPPVARPRRHASVPRRQWGAAGPGRASLDADEGSRRRRRPEAPAAAQGPCRRAPSRHPPLPPRAALPHAPVWPDPMLHRGRGRGDGRLGDRCPSDRPPSVGRGPSGPVSLLLPPPPPPLPSPPPRPSSLPAHAHDGARRKKSR